MLKSQAELDEGSQNGKPVTKWQEILEEGSTENGIDQEQHMHISINNFDAHYCHSYPFTSKHHLKFVMTICFCELWPSKILQYICCLWPLELQLILVTWMKLKFSDHEYVYVS